MGPVVCGGQDTLGYASAESYIFYITYVVGLIDQWKEARKVRLEEFSLQLTAIA
jgi:predicted methyltransferase